MKLKEYRFVAGRDIGNLVNQWAKQGYTIVPGTLTTFEEEGLVFALFMERDYSTED